MRRTLAGLLLAFLALPLNAQVLTLGAADWCPYSCKDNLNPGIVSEYLTWLLAKRNIQLNIIVMPWSRAIVSADNGEIDGLLTLVKGEAPDLLMTTTPTMSHQNCFYTRADSNWNYTGLSDVDNILLGVIKHYGYDEAFDRHIEFSPSEQVQKLIGTELEQRLFNMLETHRIDAYVSDSRVRAWQLKQSPKKHNYQRQAGCFNEMPFHIGFNKDRKHLQSLIDWLNKELAKPDNIAQLQFIEKRYR